MKYKFRRLILLLCMAFTLSFALCITTSCDGGEQKVEITQETLEALEFNDITVDYDGEKHSIFIENIPEGVEVTYVDNGVSMPGEHTVKAIIRFGAIRITKEAKIIINKTASVLTAEAEQTVMLYGGKVDPKYSISTGQSVVMDFFKDGVKISKSDAFKEGQYTVEMYAKENSYYKESNHITITLNVVQSQFGLVFESQDFEYDGTEKEIKLTGDIPSGYTVEYTENKGTEVGTYYAKALVKDAAGEVVETHAACMNIGYKENAAFAEYLDDFFVEYLEGDQLSVNIFCENPANFGLEHYEASWYEYDGITPEDVQESIDYFKELLTELETFKDAELSVLQQSAYDTVHKFLSYYVEYYQIPNVNFMNITYVDQFGGYVADFGTYMEAYSLRSELEVQDVINYINSTSTAFPSYLEFVSDKAEAGFALSDYTITEMRNYLSDVLADADNYYLADIINAHIDAVDFLTQEQKDSYKAQVVDGFKNKFMPGVQALYDGLEDHLGKLAPEAEGYWQTYENGKKLYELEIEDLLGLDLDFDAYIKELDNALSSAVGQVISKQSSAMKVLGVSDYTGLQNALSDHLICLGEPEEMMVYLKEFAKTIVPELQSDPEISIKEMDNASAKVSNAVAYYMKSALDNSQGEHITLNPLKLGDSNDVLSTLAHEGYPGHLYAYVYSKELGLSNLATIMTSTAHAEGWATYVETKLYEYAIANSEDPKFIAAMEYLLANAKCGHILEARLDVGVHYEGWGANEIRKYMTKVGYNSDGAQDIYKLLIEMPTTYQAYGYGRVTFMKLHNDAKKVLGGFYNEIEFNAMLLSKGWTDLGQLLETYNDYMVKKCHEYGLTYKG